MGIWIKYASMSGFGRKQPLKIAKIHQSERPVLGKADITLLIPKQAYLTVIADDLRTNKCQTEFNS